ncbi:MAG: ribose-phosphate pyrophosphokinase [Chloroflexota bacterium]|nr:ribose-phosphate pyrophosphokinase [Chloroflexota bacterium]
MSGLVIVAGSAHAALAEQLAGAIGAPQLQVERERFPDGELSVRLLDSARGFDAVIVQPTGPQVDENIIELLALADACRRAGVESVIAVVPYFGYARGDRRGGTRRPIMASLIARLMQAAGIGHVVTVDLHAPQIEGFFEVPLDDLAAYPLLLGELRDRLPHDVAVVSPDLGRLELATKIADELGTSAAVVQKRRASGRESRALQVVGDVADRCCLVVDDMITTGGTIRGATRALVEAGARPDIRVAATHGLFMPGAAEALSHPSITEMCVTDTLPQPRDGSPKRIVVPIAPLLAEAIEKLG